MTSTMWRVRLPLFVVSLTLVLVSFANPALAQDSPPPIPWVVVDAHMSIPRFPADDADLANSRGMYVAELPGAGLGAQLAVNLYLLRTRVVTFGIGGELAYGRATNTPPPDGTQPDGVTPLRQAEEKFLSLAPQISLNFGNGSGWSYLSAGLGATTLYLAPQGMVGYEPNTDRLKTFDYGGGARWFVKPHVAFSFDARFYVISPGFAGILPSGTIYPGTPRERLFIIAAGISVK